MELTAVGRGRDMLAVYLVLCLGEGRCIRRGVCRHGEIVEGVAPGWGHAVAAHGILLILRQPRRAIAMFVRMRYGRTELVL